MLCCVATYSGSAHGYSAVDAVPNCGMHYLLMIMHIFHCLSLHFNMLFAFHVTFIVDLFGACVNYCT